MTKCNECGRIFDETKVDSQMWEGEPVPICPYCAENAQVQEEANIRYWGQLHESCVM